MESLENSIQSTFVEKICRRMIFTKILLKFIIMPLIMKRWNLISSICHIAGNVVTMYIFKNNHLKNARANLNNPVCYP